MERNDALNSFPDEAALAGKIVLFYGEIEYQLAACMGHAMGDVYAGVRAMYRATGERNRVNIADSFLTPKYRDAGLSDYYADVIGAVRFCNSTRNRFAHCQWGHHQKQGLFYFNLSDAVETEEVVNYWLHVDVPLLTKVMQYFYDAYDGLLYLEHEHHVLKGSSILHAFPKPKITKQPSLYNPPDQHVPQWLSGAQKRRHLERAAAAKQADQPPPKKPKEKKLSKRQKRERAVNAAKKKQKKEKKGKNP